MTDADADGESEGVLFDVAELWELYVLAALRKAATGLDVLHGTSQAEGRNALLVSEPDGELGELRPDAVVRKSRQVLGILDAKYKSLWPNRWNPRGPQREDLYQLAAYLSRFAGASWGVLAYPADPNRPGKTRVEEQNPWTLESGQRVWLLSLPHDIEEAAEKLRSTLFK